MWCVADRLSSESAILHVRRLKGKQVCVGYSRASYTRRLESRGARPSTTPACPGAGLARSEHPGGDLGQSLEEGFDLGLGRERPGAEPEGTVGECAQRAVDVGGAVQAGAD